MMTPSRDFSALVHERYSCRSYSEARPTDNEISAVLEASRLAPSACNRQPWRFMVVRPEDTRAYNAILASYNRPWLASANTFIIVFGVPSEAWVRPCDGVSHMGIDVAIATEHLCLAAADLGLGTCWICNFDPAVLREGLKVSSDLEPMVILPLGYPATDSVPAKVRKEMSELIITCQA